MESDKKFVRWNDDEVQALLSVYGEEEIQRDFGSATRNDRVYAKIATRLNELSIDRTAKQVREKIKKLKQDYKKIMEHNNRSGSVRRTSKWFDRLDAILGPRPASSVSADTKDSVTVKLEVTCDEPTEIKEETFLGGDMADAEACTVLFTPERTSSPRRSVPEEGPTRQGKRKRQRDDHFIHALQEMEDANGAALRRGYEQRDRYMQLLLEAQVQEMELHRQELELHRQELEMMQAEAAVRRDFQTGLLAVLRQLAEKLSYTGDAG